MTQNDCFLNNSPKMSFFDQKYTSDVLLRPNSLTNHKTPLIKPTFFKLSMSSSSSSLSTKPSIYATYLQSSSSSNKSSIKSSPPSVSSLYSSDLLLSESSLLFPPFLLKIVSKSLMLTPALKALSKPFFSVSFLIFRRLARFDLMCVLICVGFILVEVV